MRKRFIEQERSPRYMKWKAKAAFGPQEIFRSLSGAHVLSRHRTLGRQRNQAFVVEVSSSVGDPALGGSPMLRLGSRIRGRPANNHCLGPATRLAWSQSARPAEGGEVAGCASEKSALAYKAPIDTKVCQRAWRLSRHHKGTRVREGLESGTVDIEKPAG